MNKYGVIIISILILCTSVVNNVFAGEKESQFFLGLKLRIDKWEVKDTIKTESDVGFIWGPEILYSFESPFIRGDRTFIRGFYLQGSNDFSNMAEGKRIETGVDMSIFSYGEFGFFYIGGRRLDVNFPNGQIGNITDHRISDMVFGFIIGPSSHNIKRGFYANLDMNVGFSALRGEGKVGEFELNGGYRFTNVTLNFGYGLWSFKGHWEHKSHGALLNVMYNF